VNNAETNETIKKEIAAVWTQIANKFKDKGDFLMFESFNELIYGSEWSSSANTEKKCAVINEWNQVFVDAVRATGGNNETRWLGVPGYAASPNYLGYLAVPDDPAKKTMLAFHCYDPYDYTIGDAQVVDWGHTGMSFKNGEDQIKKLFSGIYTNYIAKNIPIYMGEFGCSMRDKNNEIAWGYYLYYLEYVVKCAKTYGIAPFLWDNGAKGAGKECHAYIDHGTGKYIGNSEAPVKAMVKAWSNFSSSYTLDSVYASAPTF
jgi:endoglucanase